MRKRLLSFVLAVLMIASLLPATALAADVVKSGTCGAEGDGSNLTWTLDSDGVLTISGMGAMANYNSKEDQPWYPYRDEYKTLVLENGISSIGNSAFWDCSGFTGSLTIPDSVTSIGNVAFRDCSGFTSSLTIGNSVTSIGDQAFCGCSGFTDVFFVGDAPSVTSASSTYPSFNTDVILHYIPGQSGWTDSDAYDAEAGTWNGYQLEEWSGLDVTFISGTAFLDTGWGDDKFELYPRIQNKASITEYGFSCWDKNGNAINGTDNMIHDLTVSPGTPIEPGTRNYICCMAYIDEYGLHGELNLVITGGIDRAIYGGECQSKLLWIDCCQLRNIVGQGPFIIVLAGA